MNPLQYILKKHPIIVSLTNLSDLDKALDADTGIIILIQADISSLNKTVNRIKETDKLVFVHMDLVKGLKRDVSGIRFLTDYFGVDGIVTTHPGLIQTARRFGLITIQRVFILDSASIKQGLKSIQESRPDAVEILPGIAVPHIKEQIQSNIKPLVIAAGLINTEEEIAFILQNGAQSISSSSTKIWNAGPNVKKTLERNFQTQNSDKA